MSTPEVAEDQSPLDGPVPPFELTDTTPPPTRPPALDFASLDPVKRHREETRRWLAFGLAAYTGLLGIGALVMVCISTVSWDHTKDFLAFVFTPFVGLTGTAIGFFF